MGWWTLEARGRVLRGVMVGGVINRFRNTLTKGLQMAIGLLSFPALIRNLPRHSSDHTSLLLLTNGAKGVGPKPFRFKSCWTRDENSKVMVAGPWRIRVRGRHLFS